MWRYGRGQPGRITVAEAELQRNLLRKAAISDARRRAADTMKLAGRSEGKITTENGQQVTEPLPRIENQWCYIGGYIPLYIARAILSAI